MFPVQRALCRTSRIGQLPLCSCFRPPFLQIQSRNAARLSKKDSPATPALDPSSSPIPVKKTRAKSTTATPKTPRPSTKRKATKGTDTDIDSPADSVAPAVKPTRRASSTSTKVSKTAKEPKDVDEIKDVKAPRAARASKAAVKAEPKAKTPRVSKKTLLAQDAAESESVVEAPTDGTTTTVISGSEQDAQRSASSVEKEQTIPIATEPATAANASAGASGRDVSTVSQGEPVQTSLPKAAQDSTVTAAASEACHPSNVPVAASSIADTTSPSTAAVAPQNVDFESTASSSTTTAAKDTLAASGSADNVSSPPPGQPGGVRRSPRQNSDRRNTDFEFSDGAESPEARYKRGLHASAQVIEGGKLPPRYKGAARRILAIMVALPIVIASTPLVWERVIEGKERKQRPTQFEGGTFILEQADGGNEVRLVPTESAE